MVSDLVFHTALEQAELVRRKEASPVELVEASLARIEELDETLNAFVTIAGERALEEARRAEAAVTAAEDLSPFLGVPIAIKDLHETAGIRTTFSTKHFADYVPQIEGSAVARIRDAGFIIIGKTNAPELGTIPVTESDLNGICRNPWDTNHTPGGSSGGAAAALAARMIPVAHGSDGGGSIRIPASCCGLFGLKPSRGRISNAPYADLMAGFSTQGPIARTVRDAAALLDVMSGPEMGDVFWCPPPERPFAAEAGRDPGTLRVGMTTVNAIGAPTDPECEVAMRAAGELLESLGHKVEEAAPEWFDPELVPHFLTLWQTLAAPFNFPPGTVLEPINALFDRQAHETSSVDFVRSVIEVQLAARRIMTFWDEYDLVLTPTLALPPIPIGWLFEEEDPMMQFMRAAAFAPFTAPANLSGQPAVTLPLHWSDEGLPIGTHLIGRPASEATLIRVSAQVEEAMPWADRRPPIS